MRRRGKSLLTSVSSLKQHTAFILQHLQASVCVTTNVDVEIVTTAGGFQLFPAAELSEHHRGDLYTPLLSVLTAKRLSFNSGVKRFSTFSTTDSSRQFMWRDVGSEHFSPTSWDLHTSHIRGEMLLCEMCDPEGNPCRQKRGFFQYVGYDCSYHASFVTYLLFCDTSFRLMDVNQSSGRTHSSTCFMVNMWKGLFIMDLLRRRESVSFCLFSSALGSSGSNNRHSPHQEKPGKSLPFPGAPTTLWSEQLSLSLWQSQTLCWMEGNGWQTGEWSPTWLIFPSIHSWKADFTTLSTALKAGVQMFVEPLWTCQTLIKTWESDRTSQRLTPCVCVCSRGNVVGGRRVSQHKQLLNAQWTERKLLFSDRWVLFLADFRENPTFPVSHQYPVCLWGDSVGGLDQGQAGRRSLLRRGLWRRMPRRMRRLCRCGLRPAASAATAPRSGACIPAVMPGALGLLRTRHSSAPWDVSPNSVRFRVKTHLESVWWRSEGATQTAHRGW